MASGKGVGACSRLRACVPVPPPPTWPWGRETPCHVAADAAAALFSPVSDACVAVRVDFSAILFFLRAAHSARVIA